jgi:glycosyltransferase EpsF
MTEGTMKKILVIPGGLQIGGAEKVAADIGLFADPQKYIVHFIVFGNEIGAYEPELEVHGCKVFHMPPPSAGYGAYMKSLKKLIRTYHYDVIHAHTMFNIGWAMLVGKLYGVPVRVSHAHSALDEKRNARVRAYEAIMRFFILTCATDYVSCGIKAGERLYGKKAFDKKGKLILNGIDTKEFAFSADKRNEFRTKNELNDKFVICHAGHLAAVKNQAFLLEIMPLILKKQPNAYLILLGEGEDRAKLETKIKELHLQGCVCLKGNVRNVADYLNAADVFAFPSLYEGMPLSIIEVQANGLPCVISDGVPKDVFLTDLLHTVSLKNKLAWVDAVCRAERKEPEKYCRIMSESGFDVSTAMRKIYEIYEKDGLA